MNKNKIKYNWKKSNIEWDSKDCEQWLCKIPKLNWEFSIYTDKKEKYSECELFIAQDESYPYMIKYGHFNLEKAKKICEKYFEKIIDKVIKNYV